MDIHGHSSLSVGQQQARTRWGTHASGAAFDRKKSPFLCEDARTFIVQRPFCVIAGRGPDNDLAGLIAMGQPGFVQTPDPYTCILQLDGHTRSSRVLLGLLHGLSEGYTTQFGLFFIDHARRQRLCVHGVAELQLSNPLNLHYHSSIHRPVIVKVDVSQTFFHCKKYIRTRINGLTAPATLSYEQRWQLHQLLTCSYALSPEACTFLSQQVSCFLCTINQRGECAVNHRGGAPGFLVALPPCQGAAGGIILLPDYAGNGAFEAVGNILETGQAALVVPSYGNQLFLSISGIASVMELRDLPVELAYRCLGAERVIALAVQRVDGGSGDWSASIAYERCYDSAMAVVPDALVAQHSK